RGRPERADAYGGSGTEEAALPASVRARLLAAVLGLVLASGVCVCSVHPRPTGLRVLVRHATGVVAARHLHSRLRAVSRGHQHQSVPVVQAGLVLSAVRAGGARVGCERADSLEPGWASRAHLQSLVVSARGIFGG